MLWLPPHSPTGPQVVGGPHNPPTDTADLQVSLYSDEDRGWGSPRPIQGPGPGAVVPPHGHGPPGPGSRTRCRGRSHTRRPLSPPALYFCEVGGNTGPSQLLLAGTYGGTGAEVRGHGSHHRPVQPEVPLSLRCPPTPRPLWVRAGPAGVGAGPRGGGGVVGAVGQGPGTHRTPAAPPGRRSARSESRCGPAAAGSGPGGCRGRGAPAPAPARPGCAGGPAPAAASVGRQGRRGPGSGPWASPHPTGPPALKETTVTQPQTQL